MFVYVCMSMHVFMDVCVRVFVLNGCRVCAKTQCKKVFKKE